MVKEHIIKQEKENQKLKPLVSDLLEIDNRFKEDATIKKKKKNAGDTSIHGRNYRQTCV